MTGDVRVPLSRGVGLLDLVTRELVERVDLAANDTPISVALSADDTRLYISGYVGARRAAPAPSRYHPGTQRPTGTLRTGSRTRVVMWAGTPC